MIKILVFGNPLIEQDNLALKIMPMLQKNFPDLEFIEFDSTEELENFGQNLFIIDVAQPNFNEVKELVLDSDDSFNQLANNKIYSMHDFDLGFNLKLLKKMNRINSARIICLPFNLKEKEALAQSQLILRKWVAHDMQGS